MPRLLSASEVESRTVRLEQVESRTVRVEQVESRTVRVEQVESRTVRVEQVESRTVRVEQVESRTVRVEDHEYHFISEPKSWAEAQEFCRTHYTDLVTVNHMTDLQALRAAAVGQPDAWIGLYQTSNSLGDRNFHWSQPNITDKPGGYAWQSGRPTSTDPPRDCVVYTGYDDWLDVLCENNEAVSCYDESTGTVIDIEQRMTWLKAQLYCRTHHTDLMSGITQQNLFKAKYPSRSKGYWIGLFRDTWGWSDGSNSSFRNMKTEVNPQTKKCAALTSDGRWESEDCGLQKPFICHGALKTRKTVVKMKLSSLVDLNSLDPFIIQKLNEHLRANNITDVKLSWKEAKTKKLSKNLKMDLSLWIAVLLGQLCFCVCQDHKYHFISEPKSWTEAQEFCRRRYIDLVTVNNMSDLQALRAAANGQPDAWIGLYLTSENRKWLWAQPELTYSYPGMGVWWAGRPKDELVRNCGVLTSKNTWTGLYGPEALGADAGLTQVQYKHESE
ncbi:hypothetical protein WMY93_000636 [Mugilogobius chulae]|uniref:C-type lectin domain-containing protein n=1 Tax=Mugilogobius chulae TaxID=88201 RepID=A0AAW0Q1G5_9GOBI